MPTVIHLTSVPIRTYPRYVEIRQHISGRMRPVNHDHHAIRVAYRAQASDWKQNSCWTSHMI